EVTVLNAGSAIRSLQMTGEIIHLLDAKELPPAAIQKPIEPKAIHTVLQKARIFSVTPLDADSRHEFVGIDSQKSSLGIFWLQEQNQTYQAARPSQIARTELTSPIEFSRLGYSTDENE